MKALLLRFLKGFGTVFGVLIAWAVLCYSVFRVTEHFEHRYHEGRPDFTAMIQRAKVFKVVAVYPAEKGGYYAVCVGPSGERIAAYCNLDYDRWLPVVGDTVSIRKVAGSAWRGEYGLEPIRP